MGLIHYIIISPVIDCIGVGGEPNAVDDKRLRNIVSRNDDGSIQYCFIGNQQKLIKKYKTFAKHLQPV